MGMVTNAGERYYAGLLRTHVNPHVLHLFKNDEVLNPEFTPASYVEADFPGYPTGGIDLDPFGAAVTINGKAVIKEVERTFERGAGAGTQTVYGWYVTQGGTLLAAGRFPDPIVFAVEGDKVRLTPTIRLWSNE